MTESKMRIGLTLLVVLAIVLGLIYYFNYYPKENTMEGTLVKNEINFEHENSTQYSGQL